MRLIDATAYSAEMKQRQEACKEWLSGLEDSELQNQAIGTLNAFIEAKLTMDSMPTIEAIPFEFIVRYGNTCDNAIKTALIDLVATWEIDSPTWKPKFNAVRMKGQKNEQV